MKKAKRPSGLRNHRAQFRDYLPRDVDDQFGFCDPFADPDAIACRPSGLGKIRSEMIRQRLAKCESEQTDPHGLEPAGGCTPMQPDKSTALSCKTSAGLKQMPNAPALASYRDVLTGSCTLCGKGCPLRKPRCKRGEAYAASLLQQANRS